MQEYETIKPLDVNGQDVFIRIGLRCIEPSTHGQEVNYDAEFDLVGLDIINGFSAQNLNRFVAESLFGISIIDNLIDSVVIEARETGWF